MSETPENAVALSLRWSGMTHRGHVRPNNEDAFLALNFDANEVRFLGKTGESTLTEADYVFAVSDGMGGARSGEFASRIAVDGITRLLPKSFKARAQGLSEGWDDILDELFASIHHDMTKLGQSYDECAGMGATLSLVWVTPGRIHFGHIGDSRIYFLSKGEGIQQITQDHSFVGWQRRMGKMNEREARSHPRKNVLNQSLGAGNQIINPQFGSVLYEGGDRILICSDGVVDGLWDQNIEDLLSSPSSEIPSAQRVVQAALASSGRDNTTAVVLEMS
jgi:protein phosphatase